MNTSVGKTRLEVAVGDIALLDVEAIANAANNELWMGAGVAGAIKRAGGQEIEHEAMRQGPIAVGDAVADRRRHAGGEMGHPRRRHGPRPADRRQPHRPGHHAHARGRRSPQARSLALPAFGTGVGGFPIYACASIMVGGVRAYLVGQRTQRLRKVVFCAYDDVGAAAFKNALSGLTRFEVVRPRLRRWGGDGPPAAGEDPMTAGKGR